MKLSTKIILPIILISALLILLNGCLGIVPDESPGYTPGTITGIIASPCCSTSAESVSETCCIAPEYWCFYCQNTWSLQDGIGVVLTYGEDVVAATTTNEDGEFTFTNVLPGKNYVITAYCPDYDDNRPLVKDVALEVASTFDTKITDLVSTSLGLVVDFLVLYTEWGPEDISLDAVIADKPTFPNFPKFKALIYEVRRVVENCEVNLLTDDDVQYATCRAAEEISGLDIGCGPGYTPPPPPPDPCAGHTPPHDISLEPFPHQAIAGQPYSGTVTAIDDDNDTLTFSLTEYPSGMTIKPDTGEITWTPECEDVCYCNDMQGTVELAKEELLFPCKPIKVTVSDDCDSADETFCIAVLPNSPPAFDNLPNDLVVEAECGDNGSFKVEATDTDSDALIYAKEGTWPGWLDMDADGLISWTIPCLVSPDTYEVDVKVSDECSNDIETFTIEVTCDLVEVGLDDFRVAFEDIKWNAWNSGGCDGDNDFDYNDCVSDVNVVGKFICDDHLKEIKFTVTYQYDGSGYLDHQFGLKMPDVFNAQTYIADLDGNPTSEVSTGEGDFIIFDKSIVDPSETTTYVLTITFDSPFAYSYTGFTPADIHGDLMDVKPFIDISNGYTERLIAGMGPVEGNRVLLVPDTWQWPDEGDPIWDVYNEVSLVSCYPVFDDPGTWTLTP